MIELYVPVKRRRGSGRFRSTGAAPLDETTRSTGGSGSRWSRTPRPSTSGQPDGVGTPLDRRTVAG
ncbi:hypothetical protein [Micromonospora sp. ATA51]|uniref:hypothetical protein n=1 Tax=Micromonospora sp. ATA51 TaxID=2806098 RepID=UPI001EE471D5|nr:hypothetical protein [Micromonospora sp. ATA51]